MRLYGMGYFDTVYLGMRPWTRSSLERMLEPPSGHQATTISQYIADAKLRSTGNWGRILRDAYVEAGGVLGAHHPDAVLSVVNQVHDAMAQRYLNS